MARLTRAAFLYSLRNWERLGGVRYDRCGVLQLARNDKEIDAQQKSIVGLPADYAQFVTREEASAHAGVPVAAPARPAPMPVAFLSFGKAGSGTDFTLRPTSISLLPPKPARFSTAKPVASSASRTLPATLHVATVASFAVSRDTARIV